MEDNDTVGLIRSVLIATRVHTACQAVFIDEYKGPKIYYGQLYVSTCAGQKLPEKAPS